MRLIRGTLPIQDAPCAVSINAKGAITSCTATTTPTAAATARLRQIHSSHSAWGAIAKPAKKWVISASEENTAHQVRFRREGSARARTNHRNAAR